MCEKFAGQIAARSIGVELPGLDSFAPDRRRRQRHNTRSMCISPGHGNRTVRCNSSLGSTHLWMHPRFIGLPCPGAISSLRSLKTLEGPMKNISILALGGFIALFGLTRIGVAADSRDINTSVSDRLGTNS